MHRHADFLEGLGIRIKELDTLLVLRLMAENLTLDSLAEQFYISNYHLGHLFKQFTGLSLYQYIMKKRLTVARNMLTLGTPVTTACIECGFNDYSNFLKAFKREFGCNPSNFIKSNR